MVLDSNCFMFSLRYWNLTLKPVPSNRKVTGGFKIVPQLEGSWLCSAGTVSLVGSGGLAMASNESSIFFFLKSHPLGCDIGTERRVFLQSLQFYPRVRRALL